jgi:hypothetical protein
VKMNQTGPENLPYSLSIEPRKLIPASNKNRPIRKEMAPTKKKTVPTARVQTITQCARVL